VVKYLFVFFFIIILLKHRHKDHIYVCSRYSLNIYRFIADLDRILERNFNEHFYSYFIVKKCKQVLNERVSFTFSKSISNSKSIWKMHFFYNIHRKDSPWAGIKCINQSHLLYDKQLNCALNCPLQLHLRLLAWLSCCLRLRLMCLFDFIVFQMACHKSTRLHYIIRFIMN